jgi:ADP-heptose:LPS heptosyltransferase
VDADCRDLSLRKLSDVMASAGCVVGTSSGAMHFASLCKCPQVVITGKYNYRRYKSDWNPFRVPVNFPADSWHPSVSEVFVSTMKLLERTR